MKQFEYVYYKNSEFWILSPNGEWIFPQDYNFEGLKNGVGNDFCALVQKEALNSWKSAGKKSANIKWMKRLHLAESDEMSDVGHLRYFPRGALMYDLIADYSMYLAQKEGAVPIHSSALYNIQEPSIAEHMKLFGERSYQLNVHDKDFVLRYAACFGQFSMCRNRVFSYRHLPFKIFEIADSYRYEQQSEVSGLRRQRRFTLPDIHIFCKRDSDLSSAKEEFIRTHQHILKIAEKQGWKYVNLYNVREDFLRNERSFIEDLVKQEEQPALIRLVDQTKGYYWVLNIEYCLVDAQNRPVEIATAQIDVENAKRFNFKYQLADGSKEYPIIIHTALIGSIERFFFGILESSAKKAQDRKEPYILPLWISPVQIRFLPVTQRHIPYVVQICNQFLKKEIRVEIDDRNKRLSKKIRDAERHVIEYVGIVGDKELQDKKISIRNRSSKEHMIVYLADLTEWITKLKEKSKEYPSRPSYLPYRLSCIPEFL